VLSDIELQSLQTKLSDINIGNSRIAEYQAQIEAIKSSIAALLAKTYNIEVQLDGRLGNLEVKLTAMRLEYQTIKEELATINANITNIDAQIERYNNQKQLVEKRKSDLLVLIDNRMTWNYLAKMLNPNKIPALELEMMISSIDAEATRIIAAYDDGRFIFETMTQNANGSDKFDILVYDGSTGDKRSFMKYSVGQKCFLADAYTKALVRQRNTNGTRIYSPVIMDESDGPLQPDAVRGYYEIQDKYWDTTVLVVSHQPSTHDIIENRVDISSLID
jgi:exonuclease SbcC